MNSPNKKKLRENLSQKIFEKQMKRKPKQIQQKMFEKSLKKLGIDQEKLQESLKTFNLK